MDKVQSADDENPPNQMNDAEDATSLDQQRGGGGVDHSRWVTPTPEGDEFVAYREFAQMARHDKPVLIPPCRSIVYTQVERASVHETRTHISHVVPVAHINATTLSSVDDGSATLFRFQAGSTWFEYRLDHLKQQQQGGESCAAVLDWTVEVATQNLAIICRKAAPPP
ncbi:hypothetical protein AaE_007021, partial [Aphanomyces astaci]